MQEVSAPDAVAVIKALLSGSLNLPGGIRKAVFPASAASIDPVVTAP